MVSSDSNIGGAGKCIISLVSNMKQFEPVVLLPRKSLLTPHFTCKTVEIDGLAEQSVSLKGIMQIYSVIQRERPDIVHAHGSFSARVAAKLWGRCKIIYTRHSVFEPSRHISRGLGKTINGIVNNFFCDMAIAVANAAKDNLVATGVSAERIRVVLNGVQPIERADTLNFRKKFGITDEFVITILARLTKVKGHDVLIEAAKILSERNIKCKILIAGSGEEEDNLRQQAKGLDNVIFVGFVESVMEILSVTDLQVNCSYGTEATSIALLEGMSCGIPAVVSDFGGNTGVIVHGVNGLVTPVKSPEFLAAAIIRLYENPDLLADMGRNSIDIYKKEFTAEVNAQNTEKVYSEVLSL